ncbi:transporter substrate-binding domain-containing protein [Catenulispora yoronensis]
MRTKHIAAIALTAALGTSALSACSSAKKADGSDNKGPAPSVTVATSASFAAGSTMEKLNKAGKITIGIKIDQPGIGLKDPAGKYTGFDVEIGKIIAADLGLKPEQVNWVEAVSANRETFIQNGTVDIVIASYSITDTRKQKVSFAAPTWRPTRTCWSPRTARSPACPTWPARRSARPRARPPSRTSRPTSRRRPRSAWRPTRSAWTSWAPARSTRSPPTARFCRATRPSPPAS